MNATRLGDGDDTKADTLGGGPLSDDVLTTGAKGGLFLGLRHARHEQNLLAVAAPARPDPGVYVPTEIGGEGAGGAGDGGDGAGVGADGGDN